MTWTVTRPLRGNFNVDTMSHEYPNHGRSIFRPWKYPKCGRRGSTFHRWNRPFIHDISPHMGDTLFVLRPPRRGEKIKTIRNRKCSVNCKKSLIWIYSFFKLTVLFCYLILVKIYIFYFCEVWYLYPLKWLTDAEIINRKWQLSD